MPNNPAQAQNEARRKLADRLAFGLRANCTHFALRPEECELVVAALRADSARGAEEMEDRINTMEEALQRIVQWSEAYPLTVFPEPDLKKARALLEAGGMTLDSLSAHAMRHVVEGVGKIAIRALPASDEGGGE